MKALFKGWRTMFRIIVAAVALLAVAGGAAYWTFGRGGDDSAEAQTQVIRWVNVTVEVPQDPGLPPGVAVPPGFAWPAGPGLVVGRDFWGPESRPPALFIGSLDRPESIIVIDAETGAVIKDGIQPEDRAAADKVLETLAVSPLDRTTAPWPYSGEPPRVERQREGNITFIPPSLEAGFRISLRLGTGPDSPSASLFVTNGRSATGIDTATGRVWETDRVAPEDKEAFDRFLSTVEYVGP